MRTAFPGYFRPEPPPGTVFIEHAVRPQQCSHCGGDDLEPTGQFEDHIVADIPMMLSSFNGAAADRPRSRGTEVKSKK